MPEPMVRYHLSGKPGPEPNTAWLSEQEQAVAQGLVFSKRRQDWLLGRWTAKQALLSCFPGLAENPADWEIIADQTGAPTVRLRGRAHDIALSLSHSNGRGFCAVSGTPLRLGCDIELIEMRSAAFEETYFDESEMDLLERTPDGLRPATVTLLWSAKESVMKALGTGLSIDTRRIVIQTSGNPLKHGWISFTALDVEEQTEYAGWWRDWDGMILTVATDRAGHREPTFA